MTVVVVGDNIVDVFEDLDTASVGGNCLNVAVNLERLGIPTRYIGNVGADELGAAVLGAVRSTGLGVEHVQQIPDGATGYAMIHLVEGDRHFGDFDRGAGVVRIGEEQWNALSGADLIHTSYSSELEDDVEQLSRIAPLAFDFDSHIDDDYARSLSPHVTHGFFSAADRNEGEIDRHAQEFIAAGMETVTMTRAGRGALYYTLEGKWAAEAEDIVAVDTLGAGDAFIAGVLAGIVASSPVEDMLRIATMRASMVCTTVGSLGLYVDRSLVKRITARH